MRRNPIPTVDIIIEISDNIVLIERKNPPYGWALPGGFIDYGESAEQAAIREAREETSLELSQLKQFKVYSAPDRDPRFHTMTLVFIAKGRGQINAADDAKNIMTIDPRNINVKLAFDHNVIISDYLKEMMSINN